MLKTKSIWKTLRKLIKILMSLEKFYRRMLVIVFTHNSSKSESEKSEGL